MKLIVGNMSNAIKDFIKRNNFTEHVLVINKMCNVKTIKEPVDVIIPFGYLTDVGLISNTLVHLEELIMSVDVKSIKYGNKVNREKLDLIGKKYGILSMSAYRSSSAACCGMKFLCSGHTVTRAY